MRPEQSTCLQGSGRPRAELLFLEEVCGEAQALCGSSSWQVDF